MTNLNEYYAQQAGTGIAIYPGVRYQRGHGFFGRFFKGTLLPLLQSLGHKLLSTGVDVADDIVNNDMDPMTALKNRGRVAVKSAANDIISTARTKLDTMKQKGSGKRSSKRKSIKAPAKKKKRVISKKVSVKRTSKKKKIQKKKKRAPTRKSTTKEKTPKYLNF